MKSLCLCFAGCFGEEVDLKACIESIFSWPWRIALDDKTFPRYQYINPFLLLNFYLHKVCIKKKVLNAKEKYSMTIYHWVT